jgi:raffinose/stachyose/melibiose transport system permease protein
MNALAASRAAQARAADPAKSRASAQDSGPSVLLAAPALAFFVIFALVPLAGVIVLSLMRWDGLDTPTWIGFSNWSHTLRDPVTHHAVWVTLKIMAFTWLVQTPISLLLGVFTAGTQRYRAVLAVIYFLPLLLSSAAVAIAFKSLLDPNFGMSRAFHLDALSQDFLGNPSLVLYVMVFAIAWQFVPFHTLLYQAGVRQIPASLYEAASIDGAGRISQFRYITLPQLRNTIVTSSTLMLVGALTYFDLIFVLTAGGPGDATRVLSLDMYLTGFAANDMGVASALSVILVGAGLLLSWGITKLTGFSQMRSELEGA